MLAYRMAMESDMVEAEMVNAVEFRSLSQKHHVHGVPHTIINAGEGGVVGAIPEEDLLLELEHISEE